eukprot:4102502-Prymnesium_polylepis.1
MDGPVRTRPRPSAPRRPVRTRPGPSTRMQPHSTEQVYWVCPTQLSYALVVTAAYHVGSSFTNLVKPLSDRTEERRVFFVSR